MSDSTPTPSEPGTANTGKSLADRVGKLNVTSEEKSQANGSSSKFNWADEVETPIADKKDTAAAPQSDSAKGTSLEENQKDGATTWLMGSQLDEPEFDVNVKLADLQEDPNNPLYSAKSFEDLNLRHEILQGLSTMNFDKPSKIQERALPLLLKNPPQNLIGQSQSGTGKTAAFVLNMLTRIDLSTDQPQALVLAPTRELARQISGVCQLMGTFLQDKGLKVGEAIPNPATRGQQITGQILVGTAGTMGDALKRRQIDSTGIKILTLDEADNMLGIDGMQDQCLRIKRFVPRAQIVLFSATFADKVMDFAHKFSPNANLITLEVEQLTVKGIKQMYLDCNSDEEKYNALVKFYGLMTIASSIIFVRMRETARVIEQRMTAEGHSVASLTGELEGADRDAVFNKFRSGQAKVLITTNVLSRGIDVQTVTMVINYDIPTTRTGGPDYETYLHRIGRTGRFGRTGAALSFVHDRKSWQNLMDICKYFQVEPTKLDTSDWDEVEKMLKMVMRNARNAQVGEAVMQD